MIIRSITIRHFGAVEYFSRDFEEGINVIKHRATEELACAMGILLNHPSISPLSAPAARGDTEITAKASIGEKTYMLSAVYDDAYRVFNLFASDESGEDATAEYVYLSSHCEEQDQAEVFDGNENTHHLRLLHYVNQEYFYSPHEFARRTDGLSLNKTFRAYLAHSVKNFQPEPIRNGKPYEMVLKKNGMFAVQNATPSDLPICLSESEQRLFGYLCFLRTAEFWRGFEEIRNLHGVKKPLLIRNFLERLDESIDVRELFQRTAQLNRQLIILTI